MWRRINSGACSCQHAQTRIRHHWCTQEAARTCTARCQCNMIQLLFRMRSTLTSFMRICVVGLLLQHKLLSLLPSVFVSFRCSLLSCYPISLLCCPISCSRICLINGTDGRPSRKVQQSKRSKHALSTPMRVHIGTTAQHSCILMRQHAHTLWSSLRVLVQQCIPPLQTRYVQ